MKIPESERIYLRNFAASDIDAIFSYRSLVEIALYQYWDPYTREQTLEFINRNKNSDLNVLDKWNGFAIVNKIENVLIGDCAVKISEYSAEIGCNISPVYQNRGFAKEAIQLLIHTCFCIANIDMVYGITDSNNATSIRLMETLGMIKDNNFEEKTICKGIPCIEHKYFLKKQKS